MANPISKKRGFIALISTLIISTLLFSFVLVVSESHIIHRYMVLNFENKILSEKLAQSCIEIARVFIKNNPSVTHESLPYSGRMPIETNECRIVSITHIDTTIRGIHAHAESGSSHTHLYVTIETPDATIHTWEERNPQ
ncbi:hypothetical protein K2X96_00225 [Patescibacteria group bacterium]|nr:hypothetical protein [Patescibacteria group bacterium]